MLKIKSTKYAIFINLWFNNKKNISMQCGNCRHRSEVPLKEEFILTIFLNKAVKRAF